MCMTYKGVDYHYAFEFKIPVENNSRDRILHVVISNYRGDSQYFSGLCLENELRVISEKKMLFEAFFDIVDSIVKITTENDASYFAKHGVLPKPLLSVTDNDFLSKFEVNKQSKKSLQYYDKLRVAFERLHSTVEGDICKRLAAIDILNYDFSDIQNAKNNITIISKPGIYNCRNIFDCQTIVNFNHLLQEKKTPVTDTNFFRL